MSGDYLIDRVTSRATPSSCDEEDGEAQFPHGTLIHCEAPPSVESAMHAEVAETPLPSTEMKVVVRFSLGDGEARWLLSHRWTETSPVLPHVAHDQRRVASLSTLSLLSACVRLRQLREVRHNLQQALNPCSRTQRSNRRFTCTSLMLHLCVMLKVPSQSSVRALLVLLLCKQRCLSCLARPVWGTVGPCKGILPWTNAQCLVGQ